MVKFPMKEGGDDLSQRVHFLVSRGRKTFNLLYIPYAIDWAYYVREESACHLIATGKHKHGASTRCAMPLNS